MAIDHSDKNLDIKDLLYRLNSAAAGAAWAEFMDHFAALIMQAARQFEYEQARVNDCFLYVCDKLSDGGFRRLSRFNTRGKASFRTWLGTVVFNLCVDWHRKEFGRVQMLPAISALPAFDQTVFRLIYTQGMSKESCFQTLYGDFPDLTREQLNDSVGRVHSVLTPRQRWQLGVQIRGRKRKATYDFQADVSQLENPGTGPETNAQTSQETEFLRSAMAKLSGDQRLLVNLRFQQGLTLDRIARIMRLGDPYRANRQIKAALETLAGEMNEAIADNARKS